MVGLKFVTKLTTIIYMTTIGNFNQIQTPKSIEEIYTDGLIRLLTQKIVTRNGLGNLGGNQTNLRTWDATIRQLLIENKTTITELDTLKESNGFEIVAFLELKIEKEVPRTANGLNDGSRKLRKRLQGLTNTDSRKNLIETLEAQGFNRF
jgi:hypothetical protein